jgi:hypothetical protein
MHWLEVDKTAIQRRTIYDKECDSDKSNVDVMEDDDVSFSMDEDLVGMGWERYPPTTTEVFCHVRVRSLMGVRVIAQKTVMRVMIMMTMIMIMKISRQAETTLTDILLSASKHDSHVMYYLSVTRIIQNSTNNLFWHLDNFICNDVPHCYNVRCFLLYHYMHYPVNRDHFTDFNCPRCIIVHFRARNPFFRFVSSKEQDVYFTEWSMSQDNFHTQTTINIVFPKFFQRCFTILCCCWKMSYTIHKHTIHHRF